MIESQNADEEHEQDSPVCNTPEGLPEHVLADSEVDDDSASEGGGVATDCLVAVHPSCPDDGDAPENSSLTDVQVDCTLRAQHSPVCSTPEELPACGHESEIDDEPIETGVANQTHGPEGLYRPLWHCEVLHDPGEN